MKCCKWIGFGCRLLLAVALARAGWLASANAEEVRPRIAELVGARQLVLVVTEDWQAMPATVRAYERSEPGEEWGTAVLTTPAVVGRKGLAWGCGLHGLSAEGGKREGDEHAPAGAFRLNSIFGYAGPQESRVYRMPYVALTADFAGVDDVRSRSYNRVVNAKALAEPKDWTSAETMLRPDGLYKWGVVVEHNWAARPGFGSCIFLHVWAGPGVGTAGCTAMPEDAVAELAHWLDKTKRPVLVQLPRAEYERLRSGWGLP